VSGSIQSLKAEYTLAVTAGNRVAGFKVASSTTSSSFVIQADKFQVVNDTGAGSISPFTVTGGVVFIDSARINTITADKIAAGAITADKIAAGAITAVKIAAGTITGDKITAGTELSSPSITGGSISGGSINIGSGRFQVSSLGNVTITTGADITGTITATSGYIGTSGDGFAINSSYIRKGTKTSYSGAGTGVYIGADGIGLGTAFSVSSDGLLTATSGTIGGWTIGSTTLTGGNITLSSAGNVYAGMTAYDSGTGWYLANDGKFSVGNSTGNKLVWDGSKLKVTGGIYITDTIGIRNTGTSTLTLTGGPDNASGGQVDLTPGGDAVLKSVGSGKTYLASGGSNHVILLPNGNVGIGDGNPSQRLVVQGTGYFSGDVGIANVSPSEKLDVTGNIKASGTISAASFNSTSSRKYKTNIRNLTNGLNIINNLRPVMFDWNTKDVKNDIGMIAEEVNEILPTIVYKNIKGEIDGFEYGKLVAVLTSAIKELSAEVQELKRQINELKK
jgi:hypothetical protein